KEPLELLSFTPELIEAFLPPTLASGTYPLSLVSESGSGQQRAAIDVTLAAKPAAGPLADNNAFVNETGDTMTGDLVLNGTARLRGLPDPVGSHEAANKGYVDGQINGLSGVYAPLSHQHSAAEISSGTLDPTRLADGGISSV